MLPRSHAGHEGDWGGTVGWRLPVPQQGIFASTQARRSLPKVTYRVYRTGHCATCVPAELEQAMAWWLSHPR